MHWGYKHQLYAVCQLQAKQDEKQSRKLALTPLTKDSKTTKLQTSWPFFRCMININSRVKKGPRRIGQGGFFRTRFCLLFFLSCLNCSCDAHDNYSHVTLELGSSGTLRLVLERVFTHTDPIALHAHRVLPDIFFFLRGYCPSQGSHLTVVILASSVLVVNAFCLQKEYI